MFEFDYPIDSLQLERIRLEVELRRLWSVDGRLSTIIRNYSEFQCTTVHIADNLVFQLPTNPNNLLV